MEDVERLLPYLKVALRKESVDRNEAGLLHITKSVVALRKESVDRNDNVAHVGVGHARSLSVRRAWIEISTTSSQRPGKAVALRKESVDRNAGKVGKLADAVVALRKESVDRNM